MYKFDLSTLEDRDISDTIEALEYPLSNMAGQADDICFQFLLAALSDEWHRRRGRNGRAGRAVGNGFSAVSSTKSTDNRAVCQRGNELRPGEGGKAQSRADR